MLHVVTWFWGDKYSPEYVRKLKNSLLRNVKQEFHFIVMSDQKLDFLDTAPIQYPKGVTLDRNCFVRLQTFSREWQQSEGIEIGDKILSIDVDCVVTGELDPLVDTDNKFMIMQGGNFQPCPYNGALQLLTVGHHRDVWDDFTIDRASQVPFHEWPDDQGWLWHMIPNAAGWKCGPEHGVYVFHKPGWPERSDNLPEGARVVAFAGKRSPAKFEHLPWIGKHWS